jgi:flagellar hook-length control protein FliK
MESTAASQAAKPSKKDTQDSGDKPSDDKPMASQDDKAGATQAQQQQPAAKPKPEKSDKDKNPAAAKTGDEAPDDSQIIAAGLQLLNPQAPPPAPPAQMPIVATPANDEAEDIQPDVAAATGAAAAAAAKPSLDQQIDAAMPAAKTANAAAPVPAQNDDSQVKEPQTPEITQPDVKTLAPDGAAPKSVKTATIGKSADNAGGAGVESVKIESVKAEPARAETGKSDIARDEAAKSAAANDDIPGIGVPRSDVAKARAGKDAGKEDVTKGYAARSGGAKGPIAKNDVAKSDTNNDTGKTASSDLPVEAPANPSTAKSAAQPAQPASLGIDSVAAPQTVLPSQPNIHAITQHVQVSAQTTPNVPALAVEIAAKSQSGAKQFDIRLDPPELGRVEVRLSIDATGKASAHLSADQPQTLSLLQKDAPILARALREAGLDVSQDGLNFSLRQQTDGGNANNGGRRGTSRAFPLAASISIDATAGSAAYRSAANGRLDIRV